MPARRPESLCPHIAHLQSVRASFTTGRGTRNQIPKVREKRRSVKGEEKKKRKKEKRRRGEEGEEEKRRNTGTRGTTGVIRCST